MEFVAFIERGRRGRWGKENYKKLMRKEVNGISVGGMKGVSNRCVELNVST